MSPTPSRQNCDARLQAIKYFKSESGQSIILISTVVLSFLFFFQFALNTGLLINAKISVQAAADAAAYAGAATQARQLNAISYLNYDMRRQYKKFLFRYVFIGSMGSPEFPKNSDVNAASPQYDFPKKDFTSPSKLTGLNVPVVCIPLTVGGVANDNCVSVNLPDTTDTITKSLGNGGLNSITQSLLDSINQIQSRQEDLCKGQGDVNLFVLLSWLFRGDLDKSTLNALLAKLQKNPNGASPGEQAAAEAITGLVNGLGLYPRNIINLLRIETLKKFLNEPAVKDITLETANAWEKNTNVAEGKERSLQAFHSALVNLNTDVFDETKLEMQELQSSQQFDYKEVMIDFNAYLQIMQDKLPGAAKTGTICNSAITPFPAIGAPVGIEVVASQNKVNYAVRLKAFVKPRGLLFLPGSAPLELDAVAGAKPFGSRIGPRVVQTAELEKIITPGVINGAVPDCAKSLDCKVPDIDINPTANPPVTSYSIEYLKALHKLATDNGVFTSAGIQLAQRHAIAPNPKEVGIYNILPPPPPFPGALNSQFIPYADGPKSDIYRFYAPIYPAGSGGASGVLEKYLDRIFVKTQVAPDNPLHINMADIRFQVQSSSSAYLKRLETVNNTENGETLTFAALELPIPAKIGKSDKQYWLNEASQVLSSWGPKYGNIGKIDRGFAPRFGYSVKFVTMQKLLTEGVTDDDGDLSKTHH